MFAPTRLFRFYQPLSGIRHHSGRFRFYPRLQFQTSFVSGYIGFEGTLGEIDNERNRLVKQRKLVNLQPVKKIQISFDPFLPCVAGARETAHALSYGYIRKSNPKCIVRTEIKSDGSEPVMKVTLVDDHKPITFKLANLTASETLYQFNRLVLPLVKEEVPETVSTKGAKLIKGKK